MKFSRVVFPFVMICFSLSVMAAQVSVVTVTALGFGQNEPEALSNAVINGIGQVNGQSIASSVRMKKTVVSSAGTKTVSSRSIEKDLAEKTQGVVKSWKKISVVNSGQSVTATALVQVYVLQKSDQLKRMKLAIVPANKTPDEMTSNLMDGLVSTLTSTRKFAIIDRKNNQAINAELTSIRNNTGSIQDQVRLNEAVAPDFIIVTSATPLRNKNNGYVFEGVVEVIDYASRQVKFSERKMVNLKSEDQVTVNRQLNMLAKSLSRAILETIYPPLVLGFDEEGVTISQGSDFFAVGDQCVIKERKSVLRDPATKEFLGYETVDVGVAEVIYVDKRLSKAKLIAAIDLDLEKIAAKKYQVWRSGQTSINFFNEASMSFDSDVSGKNGSNDDDY